MLFIRQSFGRLVEVIGNNSFHYGKRGISRNINPCLYATSYHLLQWRQELLSFRSFISVATPGKLPWTVLSSSHRFLASDSVSSSQGLEKKYKKSGKKSEKKVEVVTCLHCGTGFASKDALQKHIDNTGKRNGGCKELRLIKNKEDILAGTKPHVCEECGYGFQTKGKLKAHKFAHSDERAFVCTHCSKTFKSNLILYNHIQNNHTGLSFPCPKCNKLFSHESNMRLHLTTVCNSETKDFKCGECGKEFGRKYNLTQHITTNHPNLQ